MKPRFKKYRGWIVQPWVPGLICAIIDWLALLVVTHL